MAMRKSPLVASRSPRCPSQPVAATSRQASTKWRRSPPPGSWAMERAYRAWKYRGSTLTCARCGLPVASGVVSVLGQGGHLRCVAWSPSSAQPRCGTSSSTTMWPTHSYSWALMRGVQTITVDTRWASTPTSRPGLPLHRLDCPWHLRGIDGALRHRAQLRHLHVADGGAERRLNQPGDPGRAVDRDIQDIGDQPSYAKVKAVATIEPTHPRARHCVGRLGS